jgi:GT2 family glycosyltransferase
MDISVIIVNYNTLELTKACIDSVFAKTEGLLFEVILVDNDSSDGSVEYFKQDKRIRFVEARANLGFGKANNLGLQQAKGKYVFFLNSDTILVNNAIKLFYDYCESNKQCKLGAVGCILEDSEGNHVHSFGNFPTKYTIVKGFFDSFFRIVSGETKCIEGQNIATAEQDVDYVTGADIFVNRQVVEKCGCFDSDFFMYFEDTEMQKRWSRNGYVNRIICAPRIVHLEGSSTDNKKNVFNERKLYMVLKSQQIYFKKTEPTLGYILYRIVAFLYLLPVVRLKYNFSQAKNILRILIG